MDAGEDDVIVGQSQRSPVPSFLFLLVMIFLLTSHNGDEFVARHQYQSTVQVLQEQLGNYTAWEHGEASNFTMPGRDSNISALRDGFLLPAISLNPKHASYYTNFSGVVRGDSTLYNITSPELFQSNTSETWLPSAQAIAKTLNITEVTERASGWDWQSFDKISMSVSERPPRNLSNVTENIALLLGRIDLKDSLETEEHDLDVQAVHIISTGAIYGFAMPTGKFVDIRFLPSIVPEQQREAVTKLIAPEIESRIDRLKGLIDAGVIEQDSFHNDETPGPDCSFSFFAQISPSPIQGYLMAEYESEILDPTGIWPIKPPPMELNALLASKDCGLILHITNTESIRSKTFLRKVTTYAGFSALVYLLLLVVFFRQMQRSQTPIGISRVSRITFLSQAIVDSVSFAAHFTVAITMDGRASLSLIVPSFVACMLFFHEGQFAMIVVQIRGTEEARAAPDAAPTPVSITTRPAPETLLPAPVTLQPRPPTLWSLFVEHIRNDPQARLWVALFVFLTLLVRIIMSPLLSMLAIAGLYSSMWLPQIVRSAKRMTSSGLSPEYILGTTLGRLALALYFLACPHNVLEVKPHKWIYHLALFVCFQAAVLILQETLGPGFFLPRRFKRKAYDYHPLLHDVKSLGDCGICMEPILPSVEEESKTQAMDRFLQSMTDKKAYCVAPCQHTFHTECLERWLDMKNVCPQCRRPMPPL